MQCAIDQILINPNLIANLGNIALVINQSSTTTNYLSTAEIIKEACKKAAAVKIIAIFGPQHGYAQTEQDNMQETADGKFEFFDGTTVPLYSLYSDTREPKIEQLKEIDTLLIDLQDIGCRVYTYMLSLAACLRSAALAKKRVIVLDRPNPLGLCYLDEDSARWMRVEGNKLQDEFHSFVGWYDIPLRHGLSMGELGKYFIYADKLSLDYQVIKVQGLTRNTQSSHLLAAPWTMPSPNIPSLISAMLFPAFVCLEGTNLSEGRGTTLPFQLIGAPWFKHRQCIQFLIDNSDLYTINNQNPVGIAMREHYFKPTFNKYKGEICAGIQFHITEIKNINLFKLGMSLLYFCSVFNAENFAWKDPGYEYNFTQLPINLIFGCNFADMLKKNKSLSEFKGLIDGLNEESQEFVEKIKEFFIYQ